MKRKRLSKLVIFFLSLFLLFPVKTVLAEEENIDDISDLAYPRLLDDAGLLTDAEAAELLNQLDEVSERQNFDVVIITVDSLGDETAQQFADEVYEACGYGYGEDHDGILLLISMEDRDWAISTTGYGITAFTRSGQEYLVDQFKPDLSDGNYLKAFQIFAEKSDDFLTQAANGEPYGKGNMPYIPLSWLHIVIAAGIGLLIGGITVGVMAGGMKSVRRQAAAKDYLREGSLNVTDSRDVFLYRTLDRRERPKEDDDHSDVHTSSSGTDHGGSSGKF